MNADPNYGSVWFYARASPVDSPKAVINAVHNLLVHEMVATQDLYFQVLRVYAKRLINGSNSSLSPSKRPSSAPAARGRMKEKKEIPAVSTSIDASEMSFSKMMAGNEENERSNNPNISLADTAPPPASKQTVFQSFSVVCSDEGDCFVATDFVSALIGFNRFIFNKSLSPDDRRKVLFGSDQILP